MRARCPGTVHGVCRGRRGRSPHRLRGGCCAGAAEEAQRAGVDRRTGVGRPPSRHGRHLFKGSQLASEARTRRGRRQARNTRAAAVAPPGRNAVRSSLTPFRTPGSAGGVLWRQSPPCRRQHHPMHRAACQPLCVFVRRRPWEGLRRVEAAQSGWRRRIVEHWTMRLQGDRRGRWTSSSQLWVGRPLRRRRWALSWR